MRGIQEEKVYAHMRRNVRKSVTLKLKHFEVRVRAVIKTQGRDPFESILPLIKISSIKKNLIRDEILFEVKRIPKIIDADMEIEVFAIYGASTADGEYKRYLGEMHFYLSKRDTDDKTTYKYKGAQPYYKHREKHSFIPEGL